MKPKRLLQKAEMGLLSVQSRISIQDSSRNKPIPLFYGQMACHYTLNSLPGNTLNGMCPLVLVVSQANDDGLCHHQAMKANNADSFREAMDKEIQSFKDEGTFELIPSHKKPNHRSLIPFVLSIKRKHNPTGELIKHKA